MNAVFEKWVEYAKEDLAIAELSLQNGYYRACCFHTQQEELSTK